MKVFSSELELGAAQRGERRDKLIFEHFQTPLSPSNFTALRRRVSQLRQLRFDPQSKYPAQTHTGHCFVRKSRSLTWKQLRHPVAEGGGDGGGGGVPRWGC